MHRNSIKKIKEIEEKLGIDSFEEWLRRKYLIEKLSIPEINKIVYEKKTDMVRKYMHRFGIPIRDNSERVANQWVNNENRRVLQSEWARDNLVENRSKLKEIMKTDEYRLKSSLAKRGENNPMYGLRGKDCPNWNPERTREQRIQERKEHADAQWRKEVFERDSYTCRKCGYNQGHIIQAHHMDSWHWNEEGRQDIDNGVTLCEPCHKEFHKLYGYKDNKREQTIEYLSSSYLTSNLP